jgi:dTDP-glucose 4,6-dehydratase
MGLGPEVLVSVTDRLGHDRRYAIDPGRMERELGWRARYGWEAALDETVAWYRTYEAWWKPLKHTESPR